MIRVTFLAVFASSCFVVVTGDSSQPSKSEVDSPNSETWKEYWENEEDEYKLMKKWFPVEKIGVDFGGAPVYLLPYGKWNYLEMFRVFGEKLSKERFLKYADYTIIQQFQKDAEANGGDGGVIIFDWDGFSMASFAHPLAVELGLVQFSLLGKVYKALKYAFGVNVNFPALIFLDTVKPFTGTFTERLEIYGTQRQKWIPKLLQKIPKSELPRQCGGDKIIDF